jgi:hypothetical protein
MTDLSIQPKFSDESNHPVRLQVVAEMPALKGSEKQVAWASDIRAAKQIEFGEQLAKIAGVTWGCILRSDADYIAECQAKLDAFTADPKRAPDFEKIAAIFSIAEAHFWIENRGDGLGVMARSAAAFLASA